jgi:pimeloyl-ACP methyl ester carboxylesterase
VAKSDLYHEIAGAGKPVVLLHPGFADSRIWDPQWQRYAKRFRIIRCDLRGFGRSPAGAMPMTYAADVAGLLDELGIRDAALLGCSLGGRVALELAIARPSLVGALVMVGAATPEALAAAPEMQTYTRELLDAIGKRDLDAAVEVSMRAWVDGPHRTRDQVDVALRAKIAGMQQDAFLNTRKVAASWSEEPLVCGLEDRLTEISVPTLVLVGELDMAFIRAQADLFATRIPDAQFHAVQDTAHAPSAERADKFDDLVVPFLAASVHA